MTGSYSIICSEYLLSVTYFRTLWLIRYRIKKGQRFQIPILAVNRSKAIWGEDAHEFKPNRWLQSTTPETASSIPGVWGHMMTFLGGPRACIGYRFSLVEYVQLTL